MTPSAFFSKYAFYAMLNGAINRVPPSITLAQGALESGYGRYAIGNNFFGIKADDSWNGQTTCSDTLEHYGSGYVTINDCFRSYATPFGSFRDHANFLHDNSRYNNLFNLPFSDYKAWAYTLKADGYATAPDYAEKLINIIETYNLNRYDTTTEIIRIIVISSIIAAVVYYSYTMLVNKAIIKPLM